MKILMFNSFDKWGGAARAAFRLNRGIKKLGIDSCLRVQFKDGSDKDVSGPKGKPARIVNGIRSHLDTLPVRIYPNKPVYNFTPAFMPDGLAAKIARMEADILHLHWLAAGFCRIETISKFQKPLVWTLHDSWAFTGGCHVPFECLGYRQMCGGCPVLGSSEENDLSRWVWRRKDKAWQGLNLTVVSPSRWLADCAGASTLFGGKRIEVIPNGLDLSFFKPDDKHRAREQLGLPSAKKLILFGAVGSTSDRNKGFHLLLTALQRLTDNKGWKDAVELVVFGAPEPATAPPFGLKAHYLGRLNDDAAIARLYSAADLFVAPSLLENLPNTVMEAMACGTPSVAFAQGGMADLVDHMQTGYLAQPYEADDLATGMDLLLKDDALRRAMAERSRRRAEEKFDLTKVSKQYASLYREILGQSRGQGG